MTKSLVRNIGSLWNLTAFILLIATPRSVPSQVQPSVEPGFANPEITRNYYLNDLIQPHNYTPGKNSFLVQTLHRGQRKTVLDLSGSGSVRHIWSTWSIPGSDVVPKGRVLLRIFVDGETWPSIVGTIDQLCQAAQKTGTRFVPFPDFVYKDGYNLYLPIYFANGIRIEIEALDEIDEFYTQIDYRRQAHESHSTRLISEVTKKGLVLKYTGNAPLAFDEYKSTAVRLSRASAELNCEGSSDHCEFTIPGPGILRQLTFQGSPPPDLEMEIYWDDQPRPGVQAPLKYFFADFVNAAMKSTGSEMTTYFPMPFRRKARVVLRSPSNSPTHIVVNYAVERKPVSEETPYFHASYHDTQKTLGYLQYPVLQIRGRGLFVGVNLFDSGHNHGGGDAALIDAGTNHPLVLHGICGEDYFGFAWHHTGTMTPLTGAPVHERRYRLHLENPYPFTESIQFLFGVFANRQPKSVAFWYQYPEHLKREQNKWISVDAPFKVLGPLESGTPVPDLVSDQSYETTVAINKPTTLTEHWQEAQMQSGFLDLTYHFRHYALTASGSGFVAGESNTKLVTWVYSPTKRTLNLILGHDDEVRLQLDGASVAYLHERVGFGPSLVHIPLREGWNRIDIVLSNRENVDWRWNGISLAVQRGVNQYRGLRFSSTPPSDSSTFPGTSGH